MRRHAEDLDDELRLPHGDPAAIRAAAARLRRVPGRALATAGVRGEAAAELSLVWSGEAAEQAALELAVLSVRTRGFLPLLADAGLALLTYADVLEATTHRIAVLRVRAGAARDEHERTVRAVHSAGGDPASRAALLARAELRLGESLREIRRAHGRTLDEFAIAGTRCARTLSALAEATRAAGTGTADGGAMGSRGVGGGGVEGLVGGLPLVELQLRHTPDPPAQETPTGEDQPDPSPFELMGEAAVWTYNRAVVPLVNTTADVAQAMAEHPEDVVELAFGAGMIVIGSGGQVGGLALDSTGVGAAAGVPLHIAAAGVIASGAAMSADGTRRLLDHAARNDNELLREIDGPYPDRGGPGDPLPDWQRPDGAGATWKGRVARNGKGEVWQDPEKYNNPLYHEDADSMRYMDPTDQYPNGYVRYHGHTGQTLDLVGKPASRATGHHPMTPEYTYDIPEGWNP